MSSPSCVSHVDSTSICAADASLDIRFAFDMALRARYALPNRQRERKFICAAQSTLVAAGNISNFERSEKYIDCLRSEQISSCEATYRHTKVIDIELRSNISTNDIKQRGKT